MLLLTCSYLTPTFAANPTTDIQPELLKYITNPLITTDKMNLKNDFFKIGEI